MHTKVCVTHEGRRVLRLRVSHACANCPATIFWQITSSQLLGDLQVRSQQVHVNMSGVCVYAYVNM